MHDDAINMRIFMILSFVFAFTLMGNIAFHENYKLRKSCSESPITSQDSPTTIEK